MSMQQPETNAADSDGGPAAQAAGTVYRGRVEWMDTDASGHYHNSTITRFVESAEAQLMREHGVAEYFGISPRVRYEVSFPSKLWFGQEVTVTLVLERIGTSSMTFGFEVWGEEHGKNPRSLAAHGRFVTVHVPAGGEGSEPWPEEWRTRLAAPPSEPGS
ncbi:MAG TPA: thioesterase family protein [Actinospica sp.]|nr:thioesterase family protein [Actinospica sp.]